MENLTHTLFGATLYRSWFERYVPGTLPLWLVGANLPDIDLVARLWGPTAYLHHHRGLSHSVFGVVMLALALASVWWFWQGRERSIGWLRLFIAALVAVGTHPMLDALNNYGVRPLLPFDGRWFYGDLVFIVDPWIWLLLGGALFLQSSQKPSTKLLYALLWFATATVVALVGLVPMPAKVLWLLGLAALVAWRSRGASTKTASRNALLLLLVYIGILYGLQRAALVEASPYVRAQTLEPAARFSVSPSLANPLRWEVFAESPRFFYFGAVRLGGHGSASPLTAVPVARDHPAVLRALARPEGRAVAQFSRYLLADVEPAPAGSLVILRDGRFSRGRQTGFSVVKILVTADK